MQVALHRQSSSVSEVKCPHRYVQRIQWWRDLPSPVKDLVIAPIHFEVLQEYEIPADRTKGYGDHNAPCYCAYRHVRTQLRSGNDEVFYEAPFYAETPISWRMFDQHWLVCRTTFGNFDPGEFQTLFFSVTPCHAKPCRPHGVKSCIQETSEALWATRGQAALPRPLRLH